MGYKDRVLFGDALEELKAIPDATAQMCVTSPPYWGLRDYGVEGQLGLEKTPEEYVENMVDVFNETKRVLKDNGTLWLNLGDSYYGSWGNYSGQNRGKDSVYSEGYNGREGDRPPSSYGHKTLKSKDLVGIPWRVAFALQADGWYLRSDIIWHKPNPMPESVKDRPTKSHEYIFLLSKSKKYYYDLDAIREPIKSGNTGNIRAPDAADRVKDGKYNNNERTHDEIKGANKRSVWDINTKPYPEAHFAVYPPRLIAPFIKAGSRPGDIVLDPFFGSGTTGEVCKRLNRYYLGIEINKDYRSIQEKRLSQKTMAFYTT